MVRMIAVIAVCAALGIPQALSQTKDEGAARLPITKVILYKHGVGYFERVGRVEGDATVTLGFRAKDMSDLLKSLTVLDLGKGTTPAIAYDSTKTVDQQLGEYTFDLRNASGLPGVLGQMKGADVALRVADRELAGRLLAIEKRLERKDDAVVETYYVSVLLEDGTAKSYNLAEVTETRFTDPKLQTELNAYLSTLFSRHRKDQKNVTIQTSGRGERDLFVSYVREQPVWKVSYRIVADKKEKPLLQGWAIVDNVSEDDWENVQLSLVSGLPVSFVQNLYDPLFVQRPVVQMQRETAGGPVLYEGGMAMPAAEKAFERKGGGSGRALAKSNLRAEHELADAQAFAAPSFDMMANMAQQATAAVAQSAGALFVYNIKEPVTLKRDRSALLPIVNDHVNGARVSIYNESVRARNPMEGLRLENTTGLTLEGGPVTVIEDNTYAGEALMDTLKADEKRYISFAVDLGTRVDTNVGSVSEAVHKVRINRGVMVLEYKLLETKAYNIDNIEDRDKLVVIEHPYRGKEWTLIEPKKALEVTPTLLRFEAKAPAKKQTKFDVKEERVMYTQYVISNLRRDDILSFVSRKYIDKKTEAFLLNVVGLQSEIAQLRNEVAALQNELQAISSSETSQRETLRYIGQTETEKALRTRIVKMLDDALTQKTELNRQIKDKNQQIQDKQKTLNDLISNFTFEVEV